MSVIINGSNTPTAGGVTYGNGTEYATTSAGTTGQALISAGSSAPTWGTLAAGAGGTGLTSPGTSGNVLTSNGSAWTSATPNAGSYVYLNTVTASTSATLSVTSGIDATYSSYVIELANIMVDSGSGITLYGNMSSNGGSSYFGSGYEWGISQQAGSNAAAVTSGSASSVMQMVSATNGIQFNATYSGLAGRIVLTNPSSSSYYPLVYWNLYFQRSTTELVSVVGMASNTTAATSINAFQIYFGVGNILRGTMKLYGVKGS